ncbi:peritrophin-1-like [Venturia canescens]|uniref:peritrophin-1-like n=1 Tax=Venturia canescens TaxID=32260 RepID=UPI001C9D4E47|nr:peritrophin-1-like [Venturia canescens]
MIFALIFIWIFLKFRGATGLFSTIQCPHSDFLEFHNFDPPSSLDCALLLSCKDPSQIDSAHPQPETRMCPEEQTLLDDDSLFDCSTNEQHTCQMKLKVTMLTHFDLDILSEYPCPSLQASLGPTLLPVSGNCSRFYRCDWGAAVLFECPPELHFNAELQICDWPWRAQCDFSWNTCPRPYPKCPVNYRGTLYLPHPKVCDKFYQCDWGISHLQSCPKGLNFNPILKICDWPYKANCREC